MYCCNHNSMQPLVYSNTDVRLTINSRLQTSVVEGHNTRLIGDISSALKNETDKAFCNEGYVVVES